MMKKIFYLFILLPYLFFSQKDSINRKIIENVKIDSLNWLKGNVSKINIDSIPNLGVPPKYIYSSPKVSYGLIHVDISNFKDEMDVVPDKSKIFSNKKFVKWKSKDFALYPSFGEIQFTDSLRFYPNIPIYSPLILLNKSNLKKEKSENIYNFINGGKINFQYIQNTYHITKIRKNNKEQYIYLYSGNNKPYKDNINYFKYVQDIIYKDLKFKSGTYLINLFDKNSRIYKKLKKGKNISKYIEFDSNNCLIIKNETVIINKISEKSISPKEIEMYYKNKDLKRQKVIRKLLSVFEEND